MLLWEKLLRLLGNSLHRLKNLLQLLAMALEKFTNRAILKKWLMLKLIK